MRSTPRGWELWCLAAAAVLLFLRLHLLFVRVYDPDEFEHLHAAYCVAGGQVPYRDFFEHHGPVTYYVSAPVVRLFGPTSELLTIHRCLSLVFSTITTWVTWKIARRLYGRTAAWCAILWTLTLPSFVEKSLEWRPDVIATCLLAWAAWLLGRPGSQKTSAPFAGLLLSLAVLTTQKTVFLAAGLVAGAIATALSRRENPLRPLVTGCLGAWIPLAVTALAFASVDGLDSLYRCMIKWPLSWPVRTAGGDYIFGPTAWSPGHQATAVIGLALAAWSLRRRSPWRRGRALVFLPILAHALGWLATPATYFQYYMLAVPFVGIVATGEILRCLQRDKRGRAAWVLAILCVAWFLTGLVVRNHDWNLHNPYDVVDLTALIALAFAVFATILRRRLVGSMLLVAILFVSLGRIAIPHLYWPNTIQRAQIDIVERLVPPDVPVLDGFTGFGFLRPHATYFWWLNEHSIELAARTGGLTDVFTAVSTGRPGLVLFDENLQMLGPDFRLRLPIHYAAIAAGDHPVFLLRKDLLKADHLGQQQAIRSGK